jgi:pyruvate carboxylase
VRADLGYPPLVTPTSQIVGIQAVINVLTGERYRQITREVRDYVRGLYGRPPAPLDAELVRRVTTEERPVEGRPADALGAEFEKALSEVRALVPAADDAEALSYALFPMVYKDYRRALDEGLSAEVLRTAALGYVGAMRAPAPPPVAAPAGPSASEPGLTPWAFEGRVRLVSGRRRVDEALVRRRR